MKSGALTGLRVGLFLASGLLGSGFLGCAPLYYPVNSPQQNPPPVYSSGYPNGYPQSLPPNYPANFSQAYPNGNYQTNASYQPGNSYQPAVVVVKSCDCPPQGLGFVRIQSAPPFASVYVNGKPEGETPLEYLSIPAGQAHIELIHRQFGPADTVIEVRPGQKIDLKIHLGQNSPDDDDE